MNRASSSAQWLVAAGLAAGLVFCGAALAQSRSTPVTVVNPTTNPVQTMPVYKRELVQQGERLAFSGTLAGWEHFFHVPSRKIFVIETVTANVVVPEGEELLELFIEVVYPPGVTRRHHLAPTKHAANRYSAAHAMRLYAHGGFGPAGGSGFAVQVGALKSGSVSAGWADISVSGYLIPHDDPAKLPGTVAP